MQQVRNRVKHPSGSLPALSLCNWSRSSISSHKKFSTKRSSSHAPCPAVHRFAPVRCKQPLKQLGPQPRAILGLIITTLITASPAGHLCSWARRGFAMWEPSSGSQQDCPRLAHPLVEIGCLHTFQTLLSSCQAQSLKINPCFRVETLYSHQKNPKPNQQQ